MSAERNLKHDAGAKGKSHDQTSQVHEQMHQHTHDHILAHAKKAAAPVAKAVDHVEQQRHLPKIEILDHKALQKSLLEPGHKAEERLAAAHKLYILDHKQLTEKDQLGKEHKFQIIEKQVDQKIRIAVLELDGKTAKLCLDGTVDKNGKFEIAPKVDATQKHQENKTAHQNLETRADAQIHNTHGHSPHSHAHHHSHHVSRSQASYNSDAGGNFSDNNYYPNSQMPAGAAPGDVGAILDQAGNIPPDKLSMLPNGMVYLRSKLDVDTDGGADWRKDPTGQAKTSLANSDGSSLDAVHTNYFVLPMTDDYKKMGIKLGDLAWVRNRQTGQMVAAIFGDQGPKTKIGEGSQALCRALGFSDNPSSGGTSQKEIEFLIIPGSGNGKGNIARSEGAMASRLAEVTGGNNPGNGNSPAAERILACAKQEVGNQLWQGYGAETKNGHLGCAVSTFKVLHAAGLDNKLQLSAGELVEDLQRNNWVKKPLSMAQPGDVIYGVKPGTNAQRGGGNAHVGIVADNDRNQLMVYANVSSTGEWTHESASRAFSPSRFGNQVWAFSPPTTG